MDSETPSANEAQPAPPALIATSVKLLVGASTLTKVLTVLLLWLMTIAAAWDGRRSEPFDLLVAGSFVLPVLSVLPGMLFLISVSPSRRGAMPVTLLSLWTSGACFLLGGMLIGLTVFQKGSLDFPYLLLLAGLLGGGGMDAMTAIALHEPGETE
jgi:hypothetical protein